MIEKGKEKLLTKFQVLVLQSSDYFSVIAMKARVDNRKAFLTDFRGAGKEISLYSSAERKLDVYLKPNISILSFQECSQYFCNFNGQLLVDI